MSTKLCPFCMRSTEEDICPHCGNNINYSGSPMHLPAGYVVSGMHPYVIGAALGQGGFGITYIALDMATNERVAIKEYFPTFCSGRSAGTVSAYPNQEEIFRKGKERFLDEARMLKSLSDLPSIVNVLDFFEFNNSAYLVMEFLDGCSLKEYAAQNGKLPAQKFLRQIRPLMEDLERMHQRGVVHRDIAPDNIILLPDGQMKLIDFGAARSFVGDRSMTVVVKKGFAPIEQYLTKGTTASTDVYALAATIYYCITGIVPMDSAERQCDDQPMPLPSSLGADITPTQEKALENALIIQQKTRTQSIQAFLDALHAAESAKSSNASMAELKQRQEELQKQCREPAEHQKDEQRNRDEGKRQVQAEKQKRQSKKKRIMVLLTGAVILAAGLIAAVLMQGHRNGAQHDVAEKQSQLSAATNGSEMDAQNAPWAKNILRRDKTNEGGIYAGEDLVYGTAIRRDQVRSVTFLNSVADAPSDCWDVSQDGTGSVLMWAEKNGDLYDLFYAGEGGINGEKCCVSMFLFYFNLESVVFNGSFHTENATSMTDMFSMCESLEFLDLSSLNTRNVTSMGRMFHHCRNLRTISLSSLDTSSVMVMISMFEGCTSLTSCDFSQTDLSHVMNMTSMFQRCTSLTSCDFSQTDLSNVKSTDQMFADCSSLTTVHYGDSKTCSPDEFEEIISVGNAALGTGTVGTGTGEYTFQTHTSDNNLTINGENLEIRVDNHKYVTITIDGITLQDSYVTNLSSSRRDACEYSWEIDMYGDETYSVSTMSWATSPGTEQHTTIQSMQHSAWKIDGNSGYLIGPVNMCHTTESITWTYEIEEGYPSDFDKMTQFTVCIEDNTQGSQIIRNYHSQ